MRTPQIVLGIAALTLAGASPGRAAEFCVSCSGPDAQYRCEIGSGPTTDARAWLQCITELAKQGSHDSCSVDRNTPSPCPGEHRVVAAPEGMQQGLPPGGPQPVFAPPPPPVQQAAPPPEAANLPPDAEGDLPPEGAPPKKRVPQTMTELADDTYQASKDGLKKAGETVSGTAKKAGEAVTGTAKKAGEGLSEAGSAVGGAAKKTWNCLTSLFQEC